MRKLMLKKHAPEKHEQPDNGTAAVLSEIRGMQLEIETLKSSILSDRNIRTLEEDIAREFQHLKSEVRESIKKNTHLVEKMEAEIKFLKDDMARVMSLEEEMNRLNMKSLTRDLESLKAKSHWLEGSIQKFDLDPLVERMSEMEEKIKILKASQPLILE